jgi:stearoyl-CoA desaturase (Delta-9 desaturase)
MGLTGTPAGKPVAAFDSRCEGGIGRKTLLVYLALHLLPFTVLGTGCTLWDVVLAFVLFIVRGYLMACGYHRYFAHRSYKTSRGMQFLLAAGACTAFRGGPLWWAGLHRHHHRYSDTDEDVHSPAKGAVWTYAGWLLSGRFTRTPYALVRDLASFPELRWLNRNWLLPPALLGGLVLLVVGWSAFTIGFCLSSVVLLHAQALTDVLVHWFGWRRYATDDTSRNSFLVSLFFLGEGWHNNHHHYQSSSNQGFFWWEVDGAYTVLRGLALLGLVWGLRTAPEQALRCNLIEGAEAALPSEQDGTDYLHPTAENIRGRE